MCLSIDLLEFILFAVCSALESVGLCLLQNVGHFQLLLFKSFFRYINLSPHSQATMMQMLDFFVTVNFLKILLIFFRSIFFIVQIG